MNLFPVFLSTLAICITAWKIWRHSRFFRSKEWLATMQDREAKIFNDRQN